jgi:hypothetical protein
MIERREKQTLKGLNYGFAGPTLEPPCYWRSVLIMSFDRIYSIKEPFQRLLGIMIPWAANRVRMECAGL